MFDSPPFEYTLRLRRRRPPAGSTFVFEDIHAFFVRTKHGRHKFLVEVKVYPDGVALIDFRMRSESLEPYRYLTGVFFGNQHRRNRSRKRPRSTTYEPVAMARTMRTIFDILLSYLRQDGIDAVGFYGANTMSESKDGIGGRASMYILILERVLDPAILTLGGNRDTGIIFVALNHLVYTNGKIDTDKREALLTKLFEHFAEYN